MLKKLGSVFCDPADVLAWEIVKYYRSHDSYGYTYGEAQYKLVLHIKNNLTFEHKMEPDYRIEDSVVNIPNGFWRRIFRRPVKTEKERNFIFIKTVHEKAEELMKGFLSG